MWINCLRLLGIVLVTVVTGCFHLKQEVPKFHYYVLDYESAKARAKEPLEVVLKVNRFTVSPVYDTQKIVIRKRACEQEYYAFHRWAVPPCVMVSQLIARDLRASGRLRLVQYRGGFGNPDFELSGEIDKFMQMDENGTRSAVVEISAVLFKKAKTGVCRQLVFDKVYSCQKHVSLPGVSGLACAMSMAVREISMELMKDIFSAIDTARVQ